MGKADPRVLGEANGATELVELVQELAAELRPGPQTPLGLESSLSEDAGLDSLARIELLIRIQRRFGVTLPERAALTAERLDELHRAIELARAKAGTRAAAPFAFRAPSAVESAPPGLATLVEVLEWHLGRHPDRVHLYLLEDGEQVSGTLTYRELLSEARLFASTFAADAPGARQAIGLMLPTSRAFFTAFFGVLYAGGVPVPLYPPFRPSQVEEHLRRQTQILRNAECRLLLTIPEAVGFGRLLKAQVPSLRNLETPDALRAKPLPGSAPAAGPAPGPGDLALLQYTSGSTGDPKGVALSHANLLANIRAMGIASEATSEDVFVSWLPLYHDMGLIGAWLGSLVYGFPLVVMSPTAFLARPSRWLRAIQRHGGTLSAAPNFAYEICATRLEDDELAGLDLGSWRRAFNGAEPVSPRTLETFARRFSAYGFRPEAMAPVYGLAENAVGLAFPPPGRPPRIDRIARGPFERDGQALPPEPADTSALAFVSTGFPLRGHEIRVVDPAGRELPERREGRFEFRGPSATRGYYRNPEGNRSLFRDGWLDTGDLGYLAGGEVFPTGRSKDVLIRAGRHFFPYEIEEAVGSVPGVRKGGVAAFGMADERLGTERLVVVAETRETGAAREAELRGAIGEVTTGLLGAPAEEVLLVPPRSVPKTSSGKLRRNACRDLYREGRLGKVSPVRAQVARALLRALGPELRRGGKRLGELAYAARFWGLFGLLAPAAWLAAVLPAGVENRRRSVGAVARGFFRAAGIRVSIDGLARLPEGPALVIANHTSYLDGPLLAAALPPRFAMVAKSELRRNPFIRIGLVRMGTAFVERFDPERGAEDAKRLAAAVEEGQPLVVFPEGRIRRAQGVHPFHLGAFMTSARTGAPIVPIAIVGSGTVLRGHQWFPRRGRISLVVLEARRPAGRGWSEALALRDECRKVLAESLGEPILG